jgi:IS5 family transposase
VPIERHLGAISCAAKGEPAWPPLALFQAMLLAVWHDLSDVKLAGALDDRTFPGSGQEAGPRTGCFGGSAAWAGHQRRKAIYGFKAHVAADAGTAIVAELAATPGNVHDGRAGGSALPDEPGDVYADSAHRGQVFAATVRAKGGIPRIALTGM